MSTRKDVFNALDQHSVAGAIKDAMARRRVGLRDLSEATEIPYRTLQDYLLGNSRIPVSALARIAEVLDVSADWLILGREPNLDKETLIALLEYFDDVICPQISEDNMEAAAEAFLKFYERVYIHHYSLPRVQISYRKGTAPKGASGRSDRKKK